MSSRFCAVASGKRLSGSILSGGLLGLGTPIRSPQSQPVPGKINPSFLYFSSLFKLLTLGMSSHAHFTHCFCQNLCPRQGRFIPVLHKPQKCSEGLHLGRDAFCLCKVDSDLGNEDFVVVIDVTLLTSNYQLKWGTLGI